MIFAVLASRFLSFFSCRGGTILLSSCLAGLIFCHPAASQSLEEMETLRLFYQDKDLVVTATRNPKSIAQVAENITVVTAKEIEAMNAHSVAEVLNRVPGLFVDFIRDFGANSSLTIQGSEARHVQVLVDGIPWNLLAEGSAETNPIPVGIIERIEIIKGPASSAWGSSLGGVINILTKEAGTTAKPTGSIKVSYGERSTQDYSAQIAGLAGPVGYYLFAGHQDSKGLRDERKFDATSLFSKFNLALSPDLELGLTMGFGKPRNKQGNFPEFNLSPSSDERSYFLNATMAAALTPALDLNLSLYALEQKSTITVETLAPPQFLSENKLDEGTRGGSGKLVWTKGRHAAVLGIDASRGNLDQTIQSGPFLTAANPDVTKWAFYANDTISLERWTITPGIRYDYNNIVASFLSPSLGITRRLGADTVARAVVARGFTTPPLSNTSVGGPFFVPNSDLKEESIWSYQAGIETALARQLWLKGTFFFHDVDNAFVREAVGAGPATTVVNRGAIRRQGLELEAETVPFYNLTLAAGLAYVHIRDSEQAEARDRYTYNLGVKYDDARAWQAQLFGRYTWWNLDGAQKADYGHWIWDLNLSRKICETPQFTTKVFLAAHNLFNGDEYTIGFGENKNPERWLEGGINITF